MTSRLEELPLDHQIHAARSEFQIDALGRREQDVDIRRSLLEYGSDSTSTA
jgi:hypothetical protein